VTTEERKHSVVLDPQTRIDMRIGVTDEGSIDWFVVQLLHNLKPYYAKEEDWREVARFDHNPDTTDGHDVVEEELHMDLTFENSEDEKKERFPKHTPPPHSLGDTVRFCVNYLRGKTLPGSMWTVSDPDGDEVGVLIEYSPDAGESWQPLGFFDLGCLSEDNSIKVDPSELESSTEGVIRVATTDGVNTAQDRSDEFFSVDSGGGSVSIDSPDTTQPDGEFDFTVEMAESGVGEVAVDSSDFGVELSVVGDAGDSTGAQTETSVEFTDIDEETSTYTLNVDITGGSEGDIGTVTAATGGNIDDIGVDDQDTATFSLKDTPPSPVEDVSDDLWAAVTADDEEEGLPLSDLGNAIQEYQSNTLDADVDGVSIGLSDLGLLIQYYRTEVV